MLPQDFNALLSSLDRISKAIEGKQGNSAVEVVNRFSTIYTMLDKLYKASLEVEQPGLANLVLTIKKTYVKIATEIMYENS